MPTLRIGSSGWRWSLVAILATLLWGPAAGASDVLVLAGEILEPGSQRRLEIETSESFAGVRVVMPVLVTRGMTPGPTLCMTVGIHGDELVGVETVRRLGEELDPAEINGTVITIPIANPQGFRRSSRYLPDRRDLNRYFPGRSAGSAASRIAFRIFTEIIRHCDYLIDFHTGSFHRTNLPHVRADMSRPEVARLANAFGASVIIQNSGRVGTLRRAAIEAGVHAITFEAGEPMRFQLGSIVSGVAGAKRAMEGLGIASKAPDSELPVPTTYDESRWVRVDEGGILITVARLGATVSVGEVLGTVTDPISNQSQEVASPYAGRIVGMALNQVVIPGFAAFHIALDQVQGPAPAPAPEVTTDVGYQVAPTDQLSDEDLRPEE